MASDFLPSIVPAELTLLGENPSNSNVFITSLESGRLIIATTLPPSPGTLVKIAESDRLWLGRVIECQPEGSAVIEVIHALKHLPELSRLADHFLGKLHEDVSALTTSPTLS